MSVLDKLADLVLRLYGETEGYIDNPADAQLWYNRGYANGVVAYLRSRDALGRVQGLALDDIEIHKDDHVMEWFKAYHHGFEMGERESAEVAER